MKRRHVVRFIDASFIVCAAYGCAVIGIEKWSCDNEDHDMGHELPFVKQAFTTQIRFRNPAARGMDVMPYKSLDAQEKKESRRFCKIRYGLDDMKLCFEKMNKRTDR